MDVDVGEGGDGDEILGGDGFSAVASIFGADDEPVAHGDASAAPAAVFEDLCKGV